MAQDLQITKEGVDKIRKELDQLIRVEREKLKVAISEARAHGDLKENAEYHSAKEKQALIEGRISQLQGVLANAQIIDVSKIKNSKIVFGATVTLIDSNDKKVTYQIVGQDESDINAGKISITSPIGKALLGKEEGETVIVKAPKGDVEYQIESFEFK